MAAIAANVEIFLELALKQHLLAARALRPQIVRNRLLTDDCPDLWQDEVAEPIHRRLLTARRAFVEHLTHPPMRLGLGGWRSACVTPGWRGSRCCAEPDRGGCRC